MMDRKEDREILRKGGFAENEVTSLSQLRRDYSERERRQAQADNRRLEFYSLAGKYRKNYRSDRIERARAETSPPF